MNTRIPLRHTADVIGRCWLSAEERTRAAVAEKYWGPAEENVTFIFSGELRACVESASRNREFESAFVADLQAACPQLRSLIVDAAAGLVGSVTFHGRHHEARQSASDLGLLLTQPKVERSAWPDALHIHTGDQRALLAQAKLGRVDQAGRARWGTLTKRQRELIPRHAQYMALLLYRLGGADARDLGAFAWQPCAGVDLGDIQSWLRKDTFLSDTDSGAVVAALGEGRIGTGDPHVCKTIANPASPRCRYIEVRVSWPPGQVPPDAVVLKEVHDAPRQLLVHLRR